MNVRAPRFVDIEEDTLGIDPNLLGSAVGPRTRGILPVHVFGRLCQIEQVEQVADRHALSVIEDACEALGSSRDGRPAGSYGDASVFAFYPNKQMTTGEGGVVVTDDARLASEFRSLRNQGRDEDGTWLTHVRLGYNYRLDELSAAIGVAQIERMAELRAGRARVVAAYEAALADRDWITLPRVGVGDDIDWFVYVVRLDAGIDRGRVIEHLAAAGVPARPYFSPLHLQPYLRSALGHAPGDFPVTERVAASTLALPFSARLPEEDVRRVADKLSEAVDSQFRH